MEDIKNFLNQSKEFVNYLIRLGNEKDFFRNRNFIDEVWREVTSSIEVALDRVIADEELDKKGLRGIQFEFKMHGFDKICEEFRKYSSKWPSCKIKKIALFILKFINNLLSSLVSILPGLEAFKEFKERIELALEMDSWGKRFPELNLAKI